MAMAITVAIMITAIESTTVEAKMTKFQTIKTPTPTTEETPKREEGITEKVKVKAANKEEEKKIQVFSKVCSTNFVIKKVTKSTKAKPELIVKNGRFKS